MISDISQKWGEAIYNVLTMAMKTPSHFNDKDHMELTLILGNIVTEYFDKSNKTQLLKFHNVVDEMKQSWLNKERFINYLDSLVSNDPLFYYSNVHLSRMLDGLTISLDQYLKKHASLPISNELAKQMEPYPNPIPFRSSSHTLLSRNIIDISNVVQKPDNVHNVVKQEIIIIPDTPMPSLESHPVILHPKKRKITPNVTPNPVSVPFSTKEICPGIVRIGPSTSMGTCAQCSKRLAENQCFTTIERPEKFCSAPCREKWKSSHCHNCGELTSPAKHRNTTYLIYSTPLIFCKQECEDNIANNEKVQLDLLNKALSLVRSIKTMNPQWIVNPDHTFSHK
jgi:hypothetical protein